MAKKKGKAPGRSYARLTRAERNSIERMLDRGESCRAMARELGRSPSTVSDEVARHRFVTSPKSMAGQPAPEGLGESCPRLAGWPRCCNGCAKRGGYGCSRKPKVFYGARAAQEAADRELSEARRGLDEDEASMGRKLAVIKGAISRGMSPAQVSACYGGELGVSQSTVYRWVDAGYGGMTNLELRRKVGYRKRSRSAPRKPTPHSQRRSHGAFEALDEGVRDSAWEMDTVEGCEADAACLLTLFHRPTGFQLALLLEAQTTGEVARALGLVRSALGGEAAVRRVFGAVLTDNGHEFADEGVLAALLCERDGETRLFYCDPRRADQKGGCEKNHVEIRKLLPKGRGLRFDLLAREDCSLVMSQVNSEPRGRLAWMSPAKAFEAALGEDARALMDAFGVEALGPDDLDLTPGCVERSRASRGLPPLAG